MFRWYLLNHWIFYYQTCYCDTLSWAIDCLSKRLVCCLQGQGHSEGSYNQNMTFWYIFWTSYPFATKLGLVAHHHKLDCLVRRFDYSVVVKVKVTGWFKILLNVHLDNISSTNEPFVTMVWWCIIISQSVMQENWFAVFKVKVTVRVQIIQYDCFYHIY